MRGSSVTPQAGIGRRLFRREDLHHLQVVAEVRGLSLPCDVAIRIAAASRFIGVTVRAVNSRSSSASSAITSPPIAVVSRFMASKAAAVRERWSGERPS